MENCKARLIGKIERFLADDKLMEAQRQTLQAFDRFNELEAQCRLSTRHSYLQTLRELGVCVQKPFEEMKKEELQMYVADQKRHHRPSVVMLQRAHLKRFFRWLEWVKLNKDRKDEDKLDISDVRAPYAVRWMHVSFKSAEVPYEDLPTEAEILKMAQNVDRQRDRALILLTWETGASPIEIQNLTVGNVTVNRYGAVISFPRYVNSKVKEQNQLKTEYRYRRIPVATSVPDLLTWLSMHPTKNIPSSPLFPSQKGGSLSYTGFHGILEKAKEKAGIHKRLNPYSLRHLRLTQVSEVLSPEELKEFAGHSKYSNITPRYISVSKKRIEQKIYRERGIEVKEETHKETPLTVKVCPRCKAKNSPTANFCEQCSSPINLKIAMEVQKHADALHNGSMRKVMRIHHLDGRTEDNEYGIDLHVTKEVAEILYPLLKWMDTNPERLKELQKQMWVNVAGEVMANTHKANP